jgi:hypothetical protein
VSGLGISGPAKKVWGYNGVQKGDPVVFAHQSHHMLVAEVGNGWARLIGGNSDPPPDKRYVGGVIAVTSCPVQSFTAHYRLVIA